MTPETIRAIEERCSKATPGPIGVERTTAMNWVGPMRRSGKKVAAIIFHNDRNFLRDEVLAQRDADADYLVAIWNAGPALVQEVKRLTEQVDRMKWAATVADNEKREADKLRADNARLREAQLKRDVALNSLFGYASSIQFAEVVEDKGMKFIRMPASWADGLTEYVKEARAALATEKATASDPKTLPSPPDQ